jgi:transposase
VLVSAGWEVASREDLLALIGLLQRQEQVYKEQIAELRAATVALTEANAVLAKRVAELEKKTGRNSGNSNMPPSADVFGRPKDDQSISREAGARRAW